MKGKIPRWKMGDAFRIHEVLGGEGPWERAFRPWQEAEQASA